MPSYKGHSIFAFLLACMFFHNPLSIALTFIGANIPDFDHKFKTENAYKMVILGLIVTFSLYILKLPYFLGMIIVFLGVTFYFSEHRSFTHSLFGVLTLTSAVSLILIWALELIIAVTPFNNQYLILGILIALVSFLFLNRNLLMIFLPLFFLSLFIFPNGDFSHVEIVLALFLGVFSHIVLDSFTPAGIKIFAPISSKKVYKNFGLSIIFLLIALAIIIHVPILFSLFEDYVHVCLIQFV